VCGLGLANKLGMLWLGAGIVAGLVLTPARKHLLTVWPWVVALLATLGAYPYLRWQVANDWSTVEWIHNATDREDGAGLGRRVRQRADSEHAPAERVGLDRRPRVPLLPSRRQALPHARLDVPHRGGDPGRGRGEPRRLSRAGVHLALRRRRRRLERLLAKRAVAWRVALLSLLLETGAAVAPLALPLLSVDGYIRYAAALGQKPSTEEKKELAELPQWYADMQGWSEVADAFAGRVPHAARRPTRPAPRSGGPDYGVAGAVDYLRPGARPAEGDQQPQQLLAVGPRTWDGGVLVIASRNEARLRRFFTSVERVATIECGRCMPYENHLPIWVARGARPEVGQIWFAVKNFS
jgi:hypothetical protein